MCYIAILLSRILQIHIFKGKFSANEVFDFFKNLRVVKLSDKKYVNIAKKTDFIEELSNLIKLPVISYFFTTSEIKKSKLQILICSLAPFYACF